MLTKEQFNILGVFSKSIFAELTFKQIKSQSRQRSNNVVQIALKEFLKEEIIKTKKIADVTIYYLNLDSNLTVAYLNLLNQILKVNLPAKILNEIQNRILKQTTFFVLILFGSHAKGKATDKSDVDIAVIVESEASKKDVTPVVETVKRREIRPIDYHIFTRDEFKQMLNDDIENVGKQIYKDSIIYYGYIEYLNMIRGVQK